MKWPTDEVDWIVSALQKIDFFAPDPRQMENYYADIEMLVDSMTKDYVESGEPVIVEGQKGVSLYLIRSGRAGVWINRDGNRAKLAVLEPGSCFGEISLLTGEPCTATVTVEEPMEVYRLKPKVFQGIVKNNPRLAARLKDLVQKRLSERQLGLDELQKRKPS